MSLQPEPERGPWLMAQTWRHVLFAHWPVPADALRRKLPPGVELDTYDGCAWLGVVPFRMTGVRLVGLPAVPGLSAFAELNVRTYVRVGGRPGVWFLSLDAAQPLAVAVARRWFHLPYVHARFSVFDDVMPVQYRCVRHDRSAPEAEFIGCYGPVGEVDPARPGTLAHWLVERYSLFTVDRRGRVLRADVRHEPWPLQDAILASEINTMAAAHGVALPDVEPVLHYAAHLDVRVGAPRPVGR